MGNRILIDEDLANSTLNLQQALAVMDIRKARKKIKTRKDNEDERHTAKVTALEAEFTANVAAENAIFNPQPAGSPESPEDEE